jgi:hypothetical protein
MMGSIEGSSLWYCVRVKAPAPLRMPCLLPAKGTQLIIFSTFENECSTL